jgi:hypothetical protein
MTSVKETTINYKENFDDQNIVFSRNKIKDDKSYSSSGADTQEPRAGRHEWISTQCHRGRGSDFLYLIFHDFAKIYDPTQI